MLRHGIISPEGPEWSLTDILVEEKVLVDEIALIRIPRPDPPVSLDPSKENAACQAEGGIRHIPDTVHQFITAGKTASFGKIHILIQCFRPDKGCRLFFRNEQVTECTQPGMIAPSGIPFPKGGICPVR